MRKIEKINIETIDFYERYSSHTDSQILEILKKRVDYQENARNAAVKIAIQRQLINSEQDLLSPEFQTRRNTRWTLFPQMESGYHYQRLVGSVFRFLYMLSFIPIVYGVFKFTEGHLDQAILGVGVGIVWFLLIFLLKRSEKPIILAPLFGILIFVGVFVGFKIAANHPIRIFDFVIFAIGTLLSAYFLILVKKLLKDKPKILDEN